MNRLLSCRISALLLCTSLTLSVSLPAEAQGNPYSKWGVKKSSAKPIPRSPLSRAYSPKRGSAIRQSIADAMRRDVGKFAKIYVVFNFKHLKVNGSWAYAQTERQSPDGKQRYEPVSALLRRKSSGWVIVDRLVIVVDRPVIADADTSATTALRALRKRNPQAPRDIFPAS
jgi:hypothetical protein